MFTLEKAISIATLAHEGQLDKGGEPYILHPLKVMMAMDNNDQRIVAVLHDVIEDTNVTYRDLLNYGMPEDLVNVVERLTRCKDESYDEYLDRICENPFAIKIKLADLWDNTNLSRIKNPTEKDYVRWVKYNKAKDKLKQVYAEKSLKV